jgi:hypothetical protein
MVWSNTTSGLAIWFASSAFACDTIAANATGSARGSVNRRYSSWNIVSRSCGVLPPPIPSSTSPMNGRTTTALPVRILSSITALNRPTPPAGTTSSATRAAMKSASLASDVPPGATARKRI